MGDVYKGLTIKFGGDTTELRSALTRMNRAIRETQGHLGKIEKSLKFDPTSASLLSMRLQALGEKSQSVAGKIQILRAEAERLNTGFHRGAIQKASKDMESLARNVQSSTDRYTAANAALNKMAAELTEVGEKNGVAFDQNKWRGPLEQLRSLGAITDEQAAKYKRLKSAHDSAFSQMESDKAVLAHRRVTIAIEENEVELRKLAAEYAKASLQQLYTDRQSAQLGKAKADSKEVASYIERLQSEYKELAKAASFNPNDDKKAKAQMQNLAKQYEAASDGAKKIKDTLDSIDPAVLDKARNSTKDLTAEARRSEEAFEKVSVELAEAKAKLSMLCDEQEKSDLLGDRQAADAERLGAKIDEARAKVVRLESAQEKAAKTALFDRQAADAQNLIHVQTRLENETHKVERAMKGAEGAARSLYGLQSLGMTLYSSISPMFSRALRGVVDGAEEIDAAYRDMCKTVEGTEAQFDELREAALRASTQSVVSADSILEIEAMGGQLGIAVDELQTFAEVCSNLDIATNMETEQIAESLGQLSSVMHFSSDQMGAFGDALVRLGNNMPAQESSIMNVTSRLASMSQTIEMSTPDVLAWSTAIAATGQNCEAAGTAIANTWSDMELAVNSGEESLQAFADVAGVSASQFAHDWETNPTKALRAFIQGLKGIQDAGGSVDKTLVGLDIKGVRQKQAIEGLTQTIGVLDDALTMSNDAWNGLGDEFGDAGDAAREAQKKSEGFSGSLAKLQNITQVVGSELGESVAPIMAGVVAIMQDFVEVFQGLPEPVKTATVGVLGLGAASGVLLTSFVSVGNVFNEHKKHVKESGGAFKRLQASMRNLGVRFGVLEMEVGKEAEAQTRDAAAADANAAAHGRQATAAKKADAATNRSRVAAKKDAVEQGKDAAATQANAVSKGKLATAAGKVKTGLMGFAQSLPVLGAVAGAIALLGVSAMDARKEIDKETETYARLRGAFQTTSTEAAKLRKEQQKSADFQDRARETYQRSRDAIKQTSEAYKEQTERIGEWLDALEDQRLDIETDVASLDRYADAVKRLDGAEASSRNLGELETAVEKLNEKLGTSYTVTQDNGVAYVTMGESAERAKDKILELVEAQKKTKWRDYYEEAWEEAQGQQKQAQDNYDMQRKAVRELRQSLNQQGYSDEFLDANPNIGGLGEAEAKLEQYKKALDDTRFATEQADSAQQMYSASLASNADDLDKWVGNMENNVVTRVQAAGGKADEFRKFLHDSGVEVQGLANVWGDNWESIVGLFATNPDLCLLYLDKMGVKVDEATRDAAQKAYNNSLMGADGAVKNVQDALLRAVPLFGHGATMTDKETKRAADSWWNNMSYGAQLALEEVAKGTGLTTEELAKAASEAGIQSQEAVDLYVANLKRGMDPASAAAMAVKDAAVNGIEGGESFGRKGEKAGIDFAEGLASEKVLGKLGQGADSIWREVSKRFSKPIEVQWKLKFQGGLTPSDVASSRPLYSPQSAAPQSAPAMLSARSASVVPSPVTAVTAQAMQDSNLTVARTMSAYGITSRAGVQQAVQQVRSAAQSALAGSVQPQVTVNADSRDGEGMKALAEEVRAIGTQVKNLEVAVYVDGKKLTRATAKQMNAELGRLTSRSGLG